MESKPRLYMVGLIADDLERSHDFYGRLGLDFDVDAGTHREAKAEQLTLFLDGRPSASMTDPIRGFWSSSSIQWPIFVQSSTSSPPLATSY